MSSSKTRIALFLGSLLLVAGVAWSCGPQAPIRLQVASVSLMNCETSQVVPVSEDPLRFTIIRDCTVEVTFDDETTSEGTVSDTFDIVGPGPAGGT